MCLRVYASGSGAGTGKYVSAFVDLMRGEHDENLRWPFQDVITFQLVSQRGDQKHEEWTADFSSYAGCGERVTSGERANRGLGSPMFISHTIVESTIYNTQYLYNNCLKWKIV